MKKFIITKNIKKIIIKMHPSEDKKKFKNFKVDYQIFGFIKIEITNKTLEEVLKKNQFIVGFNTMGLVIAKLFNCNIISFFLLSGVPVIIKIFPFHLLNNILKKFIL